MTVRRWRITAEVESEYMYAVTVGDTIEGHGLPFGGEVISVEEIDPPLEPMDALKAIIGAWDRVAAAGLPCDLALVDVLLDVKARVPGLKS